MKPPHERKVEMTDRVLAGLSELAEGSGVERS